MRENKKANIGLNPKDNTILFYVFEYNDPLGIVLRD